MFRPDVVRERCGDGAPYDLDICPTFQKRKQILQNYEDDKRLNCSRFELEMSEQDTGSQAKVLLHILWYSLL